MNKVMVVVASHEAARVFEAPHGKSAVLEENHDLLNPSARLHTGDLESDRGGSGGSGSAVHGMERERGAKEEELSRFVRALAVVVNAAFHTGECDRIYLVADPHVLGELRRHLDDDTRAVVAAEVVSNLVHHPAAEIRAHLPEVL